MYVPRAWPGRMARTMSSGSGSQRLTRTDTPLAEEASASSIASRVFPAPGSLTITANRRRSSTQSRRR